MGCGCIGCNPLIKVRIREEEPPCTLTHHERNVIRRRRTYQEAQETIAYCEANKGRYAAHREFVLAERKAVSDAAINAAHYVGGVTKSVGDTITGGVEALIDDPSMIADAAKNIGSTVVDGITYFPDAIVSAVAPDLSTGAKDRTNQRINNLAEGVSDSFEQAKDDLAKHNQALASGDFEGAGAMVGGYVSSIVLPAKKVKVLGNSLKPASFGESKSKDYKKTFFDENPKLQGKVVVHHAVEQQVQRRYPHIVSDSEMHSLENLRGIPKEKNGDIHLSQIRKEWNRFYKTNPNPTKEDLLNQATKVDRMVGDDFNPSVKSKL